MPKIDNYPQADFLDTDSIDGVDTTGGIYKQIKINTPEFLSSVFNQAKLILKGLIGQYETTLDYRGDSYTDGIFIYKLCNGQTISKTEYPLFFDAVQVTEGTLILYDLSREIGGECCIGVSNFNLLAATYKDNYVIGSLGDHYHGLQDHTHNIDPHTHNIVHDHYHQTYSYRVPYTQPDYSAFVYYVSGGGFVPLINQTYTYTGDNSIYTLYNNEETYTSEYSGIGKYPYPNTITGFLYAIVGFSE